LLYDLDALAPHANVSDNEKAKLHAKISRTTKTDRDTFALQAMILASS
jgi:hypothetical protein